MFKLRRSPGAGAEVPEYANYPFSGKVLTQTERLEAWISRVFKIAILQLGWVSANDNSPIHEWQEQQWL